MREDADKLVHTPRFYTADGFDMSLETLSVVSLLTTKELIGPCGLYDTGLPGSFKAKCAIWLKLTCIGFQKRFL